MKQLFTNKNLSKMSQDNFSKRVMLTARNLNLRFLATITILAFFSFWTTSDVQAQCLTVSKSLLAVRPASSGVQGNIDVDYSISVTNSGCPTAAGINVFDALNSPSNLGNAFIKLVGKPSIVAVSAGSFAPAINNAYNGTVGNSNITDGSGFLPNTGNFVIHLTAEVNVKASNSLNNHASAAATVPADPSASSNIVTIPDCWTNCQLACNNNVQISVNTVCEAEIFATMILEGEVAECAKLGFFDISLSYNNLPITLPLDHQFIGKKIKATVRNIVCNNSCWGYLLLEDKTPPALKCKPRDTVICSTNLHPSVYGFPVATNLVDQSSYPYTVYGVDACGPIKLKYRDTIIKYDCSNSDLSSTVIRIWCATDLGGYEFCCNDTIDLKKGTLRDIIRPNNYDGQPGNQPALKCDDNTWKRLPNSRLPSTLPWPQGTGAPEGVYCGNIQYDFTDDTINVCPGTFKLLRRWVILDWCSGQHLDYVQLIKVVDDQAPIITCPTTILEVNTNPWDCTASYICPEPLDLTPTTIPDGLRPYVIENCSGWTYKVEHFIPSDPTNCSRTGVIKGTGVVTKLPDGRFQIEKLPIGCQWFVYTITDGCGNSTTCTFDVKVIDKTPPVAVCQQKTVISLGSNGLATVPANVFDDHSHDNCGPVTFQVRRMSIFGCGTLSYAATQTFCCNDIVRSPIMVALQVRDASGNTAECMVEAYIQDKLPPKITCPADITVNCETDLSNLSNFGTATATDNCSVSVTEKDRNALNACNLGNIYRDFTATDAGGLTATCTQVITVIDEHPFVEKDITWPADKILVGCMNESGPEITGKPTYKNQDRCNQIISTNEDLVFNYVENVCFKILRKWTVIDWCSYDAANPGKGGIWYHTQVIKITNAEAPKFTSNCSNVNVCITDGCIVSQTFEASATDDCTNQNDLRWTFSFDENNNGSVDQVGTRNKFTRSMTQGTHKITWTVEDQCGNKTSCNYLVTVKDCKAPTPYCNNGIITVLMATNGQVTLWAKDFNIGSTDNCTATPLLKYSFTTNIADSFKTYKCSDLRNGIADTIPVTLYVTDLAGNQDVCITKVIIQDNQNVCPDRKGVTAHVAGSIRIASNKVSPNVPVNLLDASQVILNNSNTDLNGTYQFTDMDMHTNYLVKPNLNADPLNGVTTRDIVKIQKHILGVETFTDNYKLIAADVNESKTITAKDISEIRKLILGITPSFPNVNSWSFVDASYKFDNNKPFDYPNSININDLGKDEMNNDFIAVKIGDVTDDANTGLKGTKGRTANQLSLITNEISAAKGQTIHIPIQVMTTVENLEGLQLSMKYNSDLFDITEIQSELQEFNNNNYHISTNPGVINFSWNGNQSIKEGDNLITLIVEMKQTARVDIQQLEMNMSQLRPEAYAGDETYNINFNVRSIKSEEANKGYQLYQNIPNPFSGKTTIYYSLPADEKISISIHDVAGKIISQQPLEGKKGLNEYSVDLDTKVHGVLYYRLDTKEYIATRKMVVIK